MKRNTLVNIALVLATGLLILAILSREPVRAADDHGHGHDAHSEEHDDHDDHGHADETDNHDEHAHDEQHHGQANPDTGHGHHDGHAHDDHDDHASSVVISSEAADAGGLTTAVAGEAVIRESLELTGTVQAVPSRLAEVSPRFPGVVRSLLADLGDSVSAGQTLAVVESNESLRSYNLPAPIDGVVVARNAQAGQYVNDRALFQIVDLSEVWVQLDVFGSNKVRIAAGQPVELLTLDGQTRSGEISWLSPLVAHGSQSIRARVPLANPNGSIRPGQYVRAQVTISEAKAPVAVEVDALQTVDGEVVVFVRSGDSYSPTPVAIGRRDSEHAEVLSGLQQGQRYVVGNSYLVKADLKKAGAGHNH